MLLSNHMKILLLNIEPSQQPLNVSLSHVLHVADLTLSAHPKGQLSHSYCVWIQPHVFFPAYTPACLL